MTRKTEDIINKVTCSDHKDQILAYCLGWMENHFETRESLKEEEVRKMLERALASVNKNQ